MKKIMTRGGRKILQIGMNCIKNWLMKGLSKNSGDLPMTAKEE